MYSSRLFYFILIFHPLFFRSALSDCISPIHTRNIIFLGCQPTCTQVTLQRALDLRAQLSRSCAMVFVPLQDRESQAATGHSNEICKHMGKVFEGVSDIPLSYERLNQRSYLNCFVIWCRCLFHNPTSADKEKKSERERCQAFSQSLLLDSAVPPTAAQEVALRQVPIRSLFNFISLSLSLYLSSLTRPVPLRLHANFLHLTLH